MKTPPLVVVDMFLEVLRRLIANLGPVELPPMTSVQINLLRALRRNGSIRPSDLARDRGVTKSAISQCAGRLVRAGLVSRAPDPSDKRCRLLALTPAGELMANWPRVLEVATLSTSISRIGSRLYWQVLRALMVLLGASDGMDLQ